MCLHRRRCAMHDVVSNLLALWGLERARVLLIAERENRVFKITDGTRTTALRLHRPGLRTSEELRSELLWMAELSRAGISVPAPVPSGNGDFLREVDGQQASMLTWLQGAPLGKTAEPLNHPDRRGVFRKLGQLMARMHAVSDRWEPPAGFVRLRWDTKALVGPDPLWGRFWENPDLAPDERDQLLTFQTEANQRLRKIEDGLDFGLIHADLVRENVMIDGEALHLIDFDDCGFGFRLFDVATALIKNRHEPDFPELCDALLKGYVLERPLDTAELDLFFALRAVTYVGWIIPRLEEPGGRQRNKRMISEAVALAGAYLTTLNAPSTRRLGVSP